MCCICGLGTGTLSGFVKSTNVCGEPMDCIKCQRFLQIGVWPIVQWFRRLILRPRLCIRLSFSSDQPVLCLQPRRMAILGSDNCCRADTNVSSTNGWCGLVHKYWSTLACCDDAHRKCSSILPSCSRFHGWCLNHFCGHPFGNHQGQFYERAALQRGSWRFHSGRR